MIKSMTACGRGVAESQGAHIVVELQAVNRKHLDIQVHLPRTLSFFETKVRTLLGSLVVRGQISVRISASFSDKAPYKVLPNLALAEEVKKAWNELGKRIGGEGFKPEYLTALPEIISVEFSREEEEWLWTTLSQAIEKALHELNKMKEEEGKTLYHDFLHRLELIETHLQKIERLSVGGKERLRVKLESRLREVLLEEQIDERSAREMALIADKIDITEELVRFRSHTAQIKAYLVKQGAFGKTLEFLLQELGREINTLGAKSPDADITGEVILVKTEIERMKEQVQNVE
jgi:uncharacterized protein (TIGR00255 family)